MPGPTEKLGDEVTTIRELHFSLKDQLHETELDVRRELAGLREDLAAFRAEVRTLIAVIKYAGSICGALLLGSIFSSIWWAASASAKVSYLAEEQPATEGLIRSVLESNRPEAGRREPEKPGGNPAILKDAARGSDPK